MSNAELSTENTPSHSHLERHLAELCQARFVSFAEWMNVALYHPQWGYYSGGRVVFGQEGDYTTAPKISSALSHALFRALIQQSNILRTTAIEPLSVLDWVEIAAGDGALACQIYQQFHAHPTHPAHPELAFKVRYHAIEPLPRRQKALQEKFSLCPDTERWQWVVRGDLPNNVVGTLFANECFDALPCEVIRWDEYGLWQQGVQYRQNAFTPIYRDLEHEPELLKLAQSLPPSAWRDGRYRVQDDYSPQFVHEINHHAPALMRDILHALARGFLMVLDYGDDERALYRPDRGGTLKAIHRHQLSPSVWINVGEQDLSADVNFSLLAQCAHNNDTALIGYVSQASFIANAGLEDWLTHLPTDPLAKMREMAALRQLIEPSMMGEAIKVAAWSKGLGKGLPDQDIPLIGFERHDRSGLILDFLSQKGLEPYSPDCRPAQ